VIGDEGEVRGWNQPDLWAKALAQRRLADGVLPGALLMTFVLTFQETRSFMLQWDLVAEGLDRDLQQAALLDRAVAHALDVGAVRRDLRGDLAAGGLCAGHAAQGDERTGEGADHLRLPDRCDLKTFGWVLFLDQKGAANFLMAKIGLPPEMIGFLLYRLGDPARHGLQPARLHHLHHLLCRSTISTAR
jgi:hypothetical protein